MIKKVTILLFFVLTIIKVGAQNNYNKNEISVSYGLATQTEICQMFGNIISDAFANGVYGSLTNVKTGVDDSFSGAINLQYIYRINKTIGLGGVLTYEHEKSDITSDNEVIGSSKENFFTIMPVAKFNWNNGRIVRFYSKLAAGIQLDFCSQEVTENANEIYTNFAFQVSPIGIEVGNSICGFAELGYGQQGILQAGLKYSF